MADVMEALEVELSRAIRAADAAEEGRQSALTAHHRADAVAQQANRWRDSVSDALNTLRGALPQSHDSGPSGIRNTNATP